MTSRLLILALVLLAGSGLTAPAFAQQAAPGDQALDEIRKELSDLRAENTELRRRVDALSEPAPRGRPIEDGPETAAAAPAPTPNYGPILYPTETFDPYAYAQTHENYAAFAPGRGFKLADTPYGELSISAYILAATSTRCPATTPVSTITWAASVRSTRATTSSCSG